MIIMLYFFKVICEVKNQTPKKLIFEQILKINHF